MTLCNVWYAIQAVGTLIGLVYLVGGLLFGRRLTKVEEERLIYRS